MNRVKHIEIYLKTYRIVLQFKNSKDSLILHFDTPSRKFYLSLIALIVHEMKQQDRYGYVYIRKHEKRLKFLDDALAGSHASKTVDGMWEKIRKAWHYSLPNLEEAANFKIEDRDHVSPYEKGGKYLYDCTEDECDIWASLFGIDEIANKWRFKFAVDEVWLDLSDISLKYGDQQGDSAWDAFLKHLEKASTKSLSGTDNESVKSAVRTNKSHWLLYAVAVIAVILLLLSGAAILNRYTRPAPKPVDVAITTRPSIAVLPFINVSDDPDKDYFCDGLTEELINTLARVKDLRVISRTSTFYFKDKGFDLRTIGEKLNVEKIVEGSVRFSGDKLRISVQLVNVSDDSHIWSKIYDREIKNIFELQKEISISILDTLKISLVGKKLETLPRISGNNIEAYNLYLKGRFFLRKRTVEDYYRAISYFEHAIKIVPKYQEAWIELSLIYGALTLFEPPLKHIKKAKEAAAKALEIDPRNAKAITALGYIKLFIEWDWRGAESLFRQAIELNPDYAFAHRLYSTSLILKGSIDEGIHEIKKAQDLDPLSTIITFIAGDHLRWVERYDEAIEEFKKALELSPNFHLALGSLGGTYALKGLYEEAISILQKGKALYPTSSIINNFLAYSYSLNKQNAKVNQILLEALELRKTQYYSANSIAALYVCLDNSDKAFQWLDTAYEERDSNMQWLKVEPLFFKLHSDSRWKALLKKMGLEE